MKLTNREITRIALFTALISIASLILKFGGEILVPFSLQPLMIMLAGAVLGARAGALSVTAYVLLGLVGIPIFTKAPYGGFAYVLQPTFGFLLGFIAAAYVIGYIVEKSEEPSISRYLIAMTTGIFAMYLVGIPYLYLIVVVYLGKSFTLWKAIQIGLLPFIGLDLLKGVISAVLARIIHKRVLLR